MHGGMQSFSNSGRCRVTAQDVHKVQGLIERCLPLYMNQAEVIATLQFKFKLEPMLISIVWKKMEETNPEFFKAYHAQLRVKEQVTAFNMLVNQQIKEMAKLGMFHNGLIPQQDVSCLNGAPSALSISPSQSPAKVVHDNFFHDDSHDDVHDLRLPPKESFMEGLDLGIDALDGALEDAVELHAEHCHMAVPSERLCSP